MQISVANKKSRNLVQDVNVDDSDAVARFFFLAS